MEGAKGPNGKNPETEVGVEEDPAYLARQMGGQYYQESQEKGLSDSCP